ncbi:AI-2E family transporter [Romboutsia sedimentorum]|uniref:AI-2E family transporter n=1 Tax=Romboutsia sedimentorum TaxID=1368474 RepID=A0ABT7E9A5_9FIRM|nr:AI-2E family transporter [Romboutsia sedimentorum]MDK2563509.1 AI-2E family transporter [Romboutsia sedimentorum]MDK2585233.1 AI-2E family transporter [Romboutsia sedimentorum]
MKIDWNKRYTTIAAYSFLVICCSIIFFSIISEMSAFTDNLGWIVSTLQPFIIGFVIAYLLNFILVFFEEKVLIFDSIKNIKKKNKRGLSLLLTYITTFLIIYLFMKFVFPQVVDSVVGLVNDVPTYVTNLTNLLEDMTAKLNTDSKYVVLAMEKWNEFINYIISVITNLLPILGDTIKSIASSVWNIVLGLVISIYLLMDKENFCALSKKMTFALLSKKHAEKVVELNQRSNDTFGKFISGKIIDSVIIGILTFVILTIFKIPYTLLISVIIGITNIIPFFGPFFGAIPSFIIIMFVSPIKALWFLLIIFVIQQLDGNIIGPKILGDSIGISAFWILFSLLVAGKLLGLVGMIIGVPLFAIIYSILKEVIEDKLSKKGLPKDTHDYI